MLNQLLFNYTGSELDLLILKPLSELLTGIKKYNTQSVVILHFLINKVNYQPKMVLIAYNSKPFMTQLCSKTASLEKNLLENADDSMTPSVIVMDTSLQFKEILLSNYEGYYYSTSYLVAIDELKKALKEPECISEAAFYTDKTRSRIGCILKGTFATSEDPNNILLSPISDFVIAAKLPFCNYAKLIKGYRPILETVTTTDGCDVDLKQSQSLFQSVKDEQMVPFDTSNILVFKDFLKQNPTSLKYFYCKNDSIVDVCMRTEYDKSKLQHIIFYRYIEGVLDSMKGMIREEDIATVEKKEEA